MGNRKGLNHNEIWATWSGGIDSTGVVANLLASGRSVRALNIRMYDGPFPQMAARESDARDALTGSMQALAETSGGSFECSSVDGSFLWAFSPDGKEIPRRNKHIVDHLMAAHVLRSPGAYQVAMGEYIGTDTWLVQDHVAGVDADSRSLAAYLFYEWGEQYRLWTLADFGESRFKVDRLRIGWQVIGDAMNETTNCLNDTPIHCGECYKCIERSVAFDLLAEENQSVIDRTEYRTNPRAQPHYETYVKQQRGEALDPVEHSSFAK